MTQTLREIFDSALELGTSENTTSELVQSIKFRTSLQYDPTPLLSDHPTIRSDFTMSGNEIRETPTRPWLTTHSDVLPLVPTLRTHRTGPCPPDQSDLYQEYLASTTTNRRFPPFRELQTLHTAVSASPSSIENARGLLASFVSVDIVIIFDRHHVFHRFRSLPVCSSTTETLEATFCIRRRHHLHCLLVIRHQSETASCVELFHRSIESSADSNKITNSQVLRRLG